MIAPSRRLLLRIYAVSLAQLLAIAGTVALVGWLTFQNDPRPGFINEARYATGQLAKVRHDPAALTGELAMLRELAGARVTIFDGAHQIVASTAVPPARPLDEAQQKILLRDGRVHQKGPPPLVAIALDPDAPEHGYVVYRHAHPHHPPNNPLVWALTIALIGAAIASVVLARSFVTPLSALAAAARKFGEGDLSARVHSPRRDEFGQLAHAFDDMADRLTLVLRSQQELLANVSHELRTPLARIRVALDLASEGDAETAKESLHEIAEDLGELERLVADVLQAAKLDLAAGRAGGVLAVGRSERVEVDGLVDSVVARFRSAHPDRTLVVEHDANGAALTGDAVLLRRALDNLIDNARAYSDTGAAITLRVARERDNLEFAVIDRGIGIAAKDLPKIATPFFRTDPSRARRTGGLGLGLSLSRRIVEAHGGKLEIESVLDRGTTVRIRLKSV